MRVMFALSGGLFEFEFKFKFEFGFEFEFELICHKVVYLLMNILIILLIVFIPFSQCQGQFLPDADKQFDFAAHYFSNGEYFRAIGEYERFIYFFPQDDRVELAMYQIGMSYFKSKRFKEALTAFGGLIDTQFNANREWPQIAKSYFMVSECHLKLNAPGHAISNLNNLIAITDDTDVKDKAYYKIGWIYLEISSWKEARSYFDKISQENRDKYKLEKLSAELEGVNSIPRKSPKLAGVLSILPGAGYLYCERYHDAMFSFLLNGLLMYAAYESFDNGSYALGGVITFVGTGFYTGSVYGSVSSAHKYNQNHTNRFIENLKQNTKIGLSAGGAKGRGIAICFQYVF